LSALIFKWLDGGHVACLISFISLPASEQTMKKKTVRRKKEKEQNTEHLVVLA